jgi:hypothetical protein
MNQPKQLVFKDLVPASEFHPGGVLCQIIDNDGHTIIKEWWDINKVIAVLYCRNWLKMKYEGNIDFSEYEEMLKPIERIKDADTRTMGPTLVETGSTDIQTVEGSVNTSGCNFSNSG